MCPQYCYHDLVHAMHQVGVKSDDLVLIHIALDKIGLPDDQSEHGRPAEMLLKLFTSVLPNGTILVPAFSYSFCGKDEVFDPQTTLSKVGGFSNYIIKKGLWKRSLDPLFSFVGRGPLVDELFADIPHTSFGHDSVFDRLVKAKAKVCLLGIDSNTVTAIHHFEWRNDVAYRFDKTFRGTMVTESGTTPTEWTYYVRANDPRTSAELSRLDNAALRHGIIKRAVIGSAHISAFDLNELFEVAQECYDRAPFCLIQEPVPLDELERLIREDREKSQKFLESTVHKEIKK